MRKGFGMMREIERTRVVAYEFETSETHSGYAGDKRGLEMGIGRIAR